MKFGYGYEPNKNIIEKYEIVDNNVIVTYLDGHNQIFNLDDILDIEEKMINDAGRRDYYYRLNPNIAYYGRKHHVMFSLWALIYMFMGAGVQCFSLYENHLNDMPLNLIGDACFVVGGFVTSQVIKEIKDLKKMNNELEKYRIYLGYKDEILNIVNNPELYGFGHDKSDALFYLTLTTSCHGMDIGINSLDNISYKDMKIIAKNCEWAKKEKTKILELNKK